MLLFSRIEKLRYVPGGKKTVPPPFAAAVSIAWLMAGESRALPSPLAPNTLTSNELIKTAEGGAARRSFDDATLLGSCGQPETVNTASNRLTGRVLDLIFIKALLLVRQS